MNPSHFALRAVSLADILSLRHAELRSGLPVVTAHFDGDDDPETRHFGAFLIEGCVGCASFMLRPWHGEPGYQLRGMATRADLVRQGIGTALLRFAEDALTAELGAQLLWCNARLGAVEFYRRLGWAVVSEVFDIPTVGPHRAMLRR